MAKFLSCDVKGCVTPNGRTRKGFTEQGLLLHKARVHSIYSNTERAVTARKHYKQTQTTAPEKTFTFNVAESAAKHAAELNVPIDVGTPGDEVNMGPVLNGAQSLIADIQDVLTHDDEGQLNNWVTPAYGSDENGTFVRGWHVRGRKHCCDWTARGASHKEGFTCRGYFVANPNLSAAQNQKLYGRDSLQGPVAVSTSEGVPSPGTVWLRGGAGGIQVNMGDGWKVWSIDQLIAALRLTARIL